MGGRGIRCRRCIMPKRIQRSRAKGWRMPADAIYVGRPTEWGNPFKVGDRANDADGVAHVCFTQAEAVMAYRSLLEYFPSLTERAQAELRGKDLACWCALDVPCHADVLLEIANRDGVAENA